jgi:DNA polymerase V
MHMNLLPFTFVFPVQIPLAEEYQRPMFESMVSAGFPSPAQDYYDGYLNLHQYLVPDPNNVFCVRASGDSMVGAGIHDRDLLIVDRSKKKPNGKVVIASLNGEFTLKRLVQTRECFELQPENPDYPSIPVSVDDDFQIWGVVRHVIHKL